MKLIIDCCFLHLYIEIQIISVFHFSEYYVKKVSLVQHSWPLRSSTQEKKAISSWNRKKFWGITYPQETHIVHNSFLKWFLKAQFLKGVSLWCTLPSFEQISLSQSWISVISTWLTNMVIFSSIISLINNKGDYFYLNSSDPGIYFSVGPEERS